MLDIIDQLFKIAELFHALNDAINSRHHALAVVLALRLTFALLVLTHIARSLHGDGGITP